MRTDFSILYIVSALTILVRLCRAIWTHKNEYSDGDRRSTTTFYRLQRRQASLHIGLWTCRLTCRVQAVSVHMAVPDELRKDILLAQPLSTVRCCFRPCPWYAPLSTQPPTIPSRLSCRACVPSVLVALPNSGLEVSIPSQVQDSCSDMCWHPLPAQDVPSTVSRIQLWVLTPPLAST